MDLINEVMATIADPAAIPEVTNKSRNHLSNNQLADSQVVFGWKKEKKIFINILLLDPIEKCNVLNEQ